MERLRSLTVGGGHGGRGGGGAGGACCGLRRLGAGVCTNQCASSWCALARRASEGRGGWEGGGGGGGSASSRPQLTRSCIVVVSKRVRAVDRRLWPACCLAVRIVRPVVGFAGVAAPLWVQQVCALGRRNQAHSEQGERSHRGVVVQRICCFDRTGHQREIAAMGATLGDFSTSASYPAGYRLPIEPCRSRTRRGSRGYRSPRSCGARTMSSTAARDSPSSKGLRATPLSTSYPAMLGPSGRLVHKRRSMPAAPRRT
jgi:hypothetical protein